MFSTECFAVQFCLSGIDEGATSAAAAAAVDCCTHCRLQRGRSASGRQVQSRECRDERVPPLIAEFPPPGNKRRTAAPMAQAELQQHRASHTVSTHLRGHAVQPSRPGSFHCGDSLGKRSVWCHAGRSAWADVQRRRVWLGSPRRRRRGSDCRRSPRTALLLSHRRRAARDHKPHYYGRYDGAS
jgi:hypothetical protein